jgi:hypothetical protein
VKRFLNGYWKHMLLVGVLFGVFFAAQAGRITRREDPDRVSRRPVPVRIDQPVFYVRGERCLLTEVWLVCKARVR